MEGGSKRAVTRGFLAWGGVGTALYKLIQENVHATPKGMVFASFRSENMYKLRPYNMVGKRVWF